MRLGSPSITTPPKLELRGLQSAIANTRQRIEAIEAELARVAGQAGQTAFTGGGGGSASTTALQAALAALTVRVTALEAALTALTSRVAVLEAAPATNADGVLYDNFGRALLSSTGAAILIGP